MLQSTTSALSIELGLKNIPVQKKLEMAILEWILKYETLKARHSTQTTLTVFSKK